MALAKLRKVGGSTIVAIPPVLLEELKVGAEAVFDLTIREGALVMRPQRPRYTLAGLLAQCDLDAPLSPAEREWMDASAVGLEVLPEDEVPAAKA